MSKVRSAGARSTETTTKGKNILVLDNITNKYKSVKTDVTVSTWTKPVQIPEVSLKKSYFVPKE